MQIIIPKNNPSKFLNDFPSFLIKIILLIVTKEKVISDIGSKIIDIKGKRKNYFEKSEFLS